MQYIATFANGSHYSTESPVRMLDWMLDQSDHGNYWQEVTGPDIDGMDVRDWFFAMTLD